MAAKKPQDHKTKKTATLSLTDLSGAATAEPFRFDTEGNGVITFPDPKDMDWVDAEELMSLFDDGEAKPSDIFRAWLSDDDFAALQGCGLGFMSMVELVKHLQAHYSEVFGTSGE